MAESSAGHKPGSNVANPYAAPLAAVADVGIDAERATRWERLGASFVDGLIFGAVGVLGALVVPALGPGARPFAAVLIALGFIAVVAVNLRLLYLYGATIGKRALKIRITRTDGSDAGLARLVLLRGLPQWIVSALPYINLLGLVDVLFIFGAPRRCLHDYIADTIVVKAQ